MGTRVCVCICVFINRSPLKSLDNFFKKYRNFADG